MNASKDLWMISVLQFFAEYTSFILVALIKKANNLYINKPEALIIYIKYIVEVRTPKYIYV